MVGGGEERGGKGHWLHGEMVPEPFNENWEAFSSPKMLILSLEIHPLPVNISYFTLHSHVANQSINSKKTSDSLSAHHPHFFTHSHQSGSTSTGACLPHIFHTLTHVGVQRPRAYASRRHRLRDGGPLQGPCLGGHRHRHADPPGAAAGWV